jgi:thiamine-phosphate pyrophosphorylase
MLLYAITDRSLAPSGDLLLQASSLIRAGVDWLQIREKDLPDRVLVAALKMLVPEARRFGVTLLVNGRLDLAAAAGAAGVHLPSDGLPVHRVRREFPRPFVIVRSCHRAEEVLKAAEGGADAVTLGPVFPTPSKAAWGPPMGLEAFASACDRSPVPVFALGGVDASRLGALAGAGAAGAAAIRLFCAMRRPLEELSALRNLAASPTSESRRPSNTFDRE